MDYYFYQLVMDALNPTYPFGRDYSTISPSAKSLLLMKGYTNIPWAREAADLLVSSGNYQVTFEKNNEFWHKVLHFEHRYWSIDQLMQNRPVHNILEISSGFSFRGAEKVIHYPVYYIDTDLPEIITIKEKIRQGFRSYPSQLQGSLHTLPLNALDERQFNATINQFPPGEIVIVNEGLLMYLGPEEKEKLCQTIYQILKARGGYWITADIYLRQPYDKFMLKIDDQEKTFFEQHRIEQNKFESFESARELFENNGFVIDQEATIDFSKLSTLQHLHGHTDISSLAERLKIQTSWRLRV